MASTERTKRVTVEEVVSVLHEADGYLSLMHRYPSSPVPEDLRQEMLAASGKVRSVVNRIEVDGIKTSHTLTAEDWSR